MHQRIKVIEIDKPRFRALLSHARSPAADYVSKEIAWFANEDEKIIGVVLLDLVDKDFTSIILSRDDANIYGAIDVQTDIETSEKAIGLTYDLIRWHTGSDKKINLHNEKKEIIDIFKPIVSADKYHPFFARVLNDDLFSSAKEIITRIMPHFTDIDGNFVQQFQTTGFDARLWELYLFSYLHEEGFFFDRNYNAPDFLVTRYGITVGVEAVTVGRKDDNAVKMIKSPDELKKYQEENLQEKLQDEIPMKFGSPLFSKLKKEYWKLPQMKETALVFALADFHDDASMTWTSSALDTYLYGVKHGYHFEGEKLIIDPVKVDKHVFGEKEIPSGFFFQEGSEYVSAVLFSSSATVSKFNRMGKISGFGDTSVKLTRMGLCHDHDPNATVPKSFMIEVTPETCTESWAEGLIMHHNPNAKIPIDRDLFPSIAHNYYENDQLISYMPDFHPFSSFTFMVKNTKA